MEKWTDVGKIPTVIPFADPGTVFKEEIPQTNEAELDNFLNNESSPKARPRLKQPTKKARAPKPNINGFKPKVEQQKTLKALFDKCMQAKERQKSVKKAHSGQKTSQKHS